jgi:cell division protease FtsH
MIDQEVHSLINNAYSKAMNILKTNIEILHKVANTLLEKETLNKEEFESISIGVRSATQLGQA